MGRIGVSLERRTESFWNRVDKSGECWTWQGALNRGGYGIASHNGKNIVAHRRSWILTNGDIPEGLLACHKCDNRKCVRPDHLFLGTHQDNYNDMLSKGRSADQQYYAQFGVKNDKEYRALMNKRYVEEKISKGEIVRQGMIHNIIDIEEASELWGLVPSYIKDLCRKKLGPEGKAVKKGKTWIIERNTPNPAQPDSPKNWRKKMKEGQGK